MGIKIALAGNPNSGKTTLFNALTGSNQFVGNWPGVTVEKKEGYLKGNKDVTIVDLPGIYSLSPYTLEEVVAREFLLNEKPDAILNIVDGTNLERNLYLSTQIAELAIPMVIAINMMDIVNKRGDKIDIKLLSQSIGCEIVEISALTEDGILQAANRAVEIAKGKQKMVAIHRFSGGVEHAIAHIEEAVLHSFPKENQRWLAVKLFERDKKVIETLKVSQDILNHIEQDIKDCEIEMDDDSESIITSERYDYIVSIIKDSYLKKDAGKMTSSDKIDKVLTNKFLALPIFAAIMFFVYYISITTVGTFLTDWTNDVLFGEIISPSVEGFLLSVGTAPWLQGLIVEGIIGGVGAVLGFVPQMLVLFAFLAFLEACGYMARIAFIMDKLFRYFGLSGKSFIPMLIGTGCSVPGIMASRTIENEADRKMTIITTSFIPCSAKLPVIALIAGALFGEAWWVAASAYFVGIAAVLVSGIILKKTSGFKSNPAPFVMELPAYHMPTVKNLASSVWERGSSFIKKAGTIILLSAVGIWFISNFGITEQGFGMVDDLSQGFLAYIGKGFAWIFTPLGWGDWRAAVAAIMGLVAKENVVGTLGVLFGFAQASENGVEIWSALALNFSALSAYSFLMFNLLCAPCFAAVGAIKREMNSTKWTIFAVAYQTGFAYAVALCVYQIGSFVTGGGLNVFTIIAFLIVALFVYFMVKKPNDSLAIKSADSADKKEKVWQQ